MLACCGLCSGLPRCMQALTQHALHHGGLSAGCSLASVSRHLHGRRRLSACCGAELAGPELCACLLFSGASILANSLGLVCTAAVRQQVAAVKVFQRRQNGVLGTPAWQLSAGSLLWRRTCRAWAVCLSAMLRSHHTGRQRTALGVICTGAVRRQTAAMDVLQRCQRGVLGPLGGPRLADSLLWCRTCRAFTVCLAVTLRRWRTDRQPSRWSRHLQHARLGEGYPVAQPAPPWRLAALVLLRGHCAVARSVPRPARSAAMWQLAWLVADLRASCEGCSACQIFAKSETWGGDATGRLFCSLPCIWLPAGAGAGRCERRLWPGCRARGVLGRW